MTKIEINGRKYTATVRSVPGHSTWASVRVGSRSISSHEYPYGYSGNAIDGLLAAVRASYPSAEVVS